MVSKQVAIEQKVAANPLSRTGSACALLTAILAAFIASGCVGLTGGSKSNSILTAEPSSLNFGDIATGESVTRSVAVTNSGAAEMAVSEVSISGAGFSVSGIPAGLVLAPGASAAMNVTFAPASSGKTNGKISLWQKPFPILAVTVSGNGVDAGDHTVTLTWSASPSTVTGYRIYRSDAAGGPYTALNPSLTPQLRWSDSNVQSGATYHYVVTAVAPDSAESDYSNQASAAIPTS